MEIENDREEKEEEVVKEEEKQEFRNLETVNKQGVLLPEDNVETSKDPSVTPKSSSRNKRSKIYPCLC